MLVQFLKDNKYLDAKNKGTEALAKSIKEGTFEIPEEISSIAEGMKEKVIEAIQQKFDSNKVEIKDRDERITVKVKKEALAGPFIELWEKIKYKTNNMAITFFSDNTIK